MGSDGDALEAGVLVQCVAKADVGSAKTDFRNGIEAALVVAVGGVPIVRLDEFFHLVEAGGVTELAKGDHERQAGEVQV